MKKLLIAIIILAMAPTSYGWPWGKDVPEVDLTKKEEVKPPPPEPKKLEVVECFYAYPWHEHTDGKKVYLILRTQALGGCGAMEHVGLLDDKKNHFEQYRGQMKALAGEYQETERPTLIKTLWGDLIEIKMYEGE